MIVTIWNLNLLSISNCCHGNWEFSNLCKLGSSSVSENKCVTNLLVYAKRILNLLMKMPCWERLWSPLADSLTHKIDLNILNWVSLYVTAFESLFYQIISVYGLRPIFQSYFHFQSSQKICNWKRIIFKCIEVDEGLLSLNGENLILDN